jgi:hypothetical protein
MAKSTQKITLSQSRDIPFNNQANVRRIKAGVSIEELAEDSPAARSCRVSPSGPSLTTMALRPACLKSRPAGGDIARLSSS